MHLPTAPRRWADPTRGGRPGQRWGQSQPHLTTYSRRANLPELFPGGCWGWPQLCPGPTPRPERFAPRAPDAAHPLSAASPLYLLRLESLQVRGPNIGTSTTGSATVASPDMAIRYVRANAPAKSQRVRSQDGRSRSPPGGTAQPGRVELTVGTNGHHWHNCAVVGTRNAARRSEASPTGHGTNDEQRTI